MRPATRAGGARLLGLLAIAALFVAAPSGAVAAPLSPVASAARPVAATSIVGSVRRTTVVLYARGHPTVTSKALFVVASHTAVRVKRVALDEHRRTWFLVTVNGRPGWIAGWLTSAVVPRVITAAMLWHSAIASSFGVGDGLLGSPLACGGRLTSTVLAVANRTLPCGTYVRIKVGSRSIVGRVLDRGPYVAGRSFDLGPAVCRALLACDGVHRIDWQVAH